MHASRPSGGPVEQFQVDPGQQGPWAKELDDITRAFAGAFLFGIPLLMTMEMWWIGTFLQLWQILAFLGLAFAFSLYLNSFAGFKRESAVRTPFIHAANAVAVGLIGSAVLLLALNRFQLTDPLGSILGKIMLEAVPLSLGASVANAIVTPGGQTRTGHGEREPSDDRNGVSRNNDQRKGDEQRGTQNEPGPWRITLSNVGSTIAGGIFVGFTVAPTVEIPMLAVELGVWHTIGLVLLTILITHFILFESGFSPQRIRRDKQGLVRSPYIQTVMVYAIALIVALVLLCFLGRAGPNYPLPYLASLAIVLGLPTAIGGAAGRLIV